MTPLEQHIYVEQKIQKMASNQNRDLLPQEIDLALNIAQMEIIKERTRKTEPNTGFATDVRQLSDIDDLIVRNYQLTVYKDPAGGDNKALPAFSFLPQNYFSLVDSNIRCRVYSDCKTDYTQTTTPEILYLSFVPFVNTTQTSNIYSNLTFSIGDSIIISPSDVYNSAYPYLSPDEKFTVINTMLEVFNYKFRVGEINFEVFWERFDNLYKKDTFIVVSKTPISSIFFTYNEISASATLNQQLELDKFSVTNFENEVPGRLTKNEFLSVVKERYHSRTDKKSPILSLSNDNLQCFYNLGFIINKVVVDYVRKPNRISLPLNRSCELAEPLHYEICDRAAEIIMLDTANQLYKLKQERNLTQLN